MEAVIHIDIFHVADNRLLWKGNTPGVVPRVGEFIRLGANRWRVVEVVWVCQGTWLSAYVLVEDAE